MTAIATRNSVLGVVSEVTQGTLLAPTAATDFVPLQDDFAMDANFGKVENAELRSSIGVAAPIVLGEDPTSSFSFYPKASGTEGTAPTWSDIAESFFGSKATETVQRTTNTAAANVDTFGIETFAASTSGDHAIFSDTAGNTWAFALDKTGSAPAPTGALYTAVAAGRKTKVDISTATTATEVADLLRTALNLLSGFAALFTTSGTATLIITSDAVGYVAPAHVYDSGETTSTGVMTYTHTTAGRTASTANLFQSTDAETYMQLGYGMLIKDGTNGYRVRVVHSVSVDAITPSFNVPTGPAGGIGLGKPVFWKPANSGHPSLSLWWYGGNGGVVQAVAGALVSDLSYSAKANTAINGKCSFQGLSWYFDPIEITASTKYIDWTNDDGTYAAAVTVKVYKDPKELAEALTSAMNAAAVAGGSDEVMTVTYTDSTGKFQFIGTGTLLTLKWNTGSNTANSIAAKIGFSTAADSTGTGASTGYASTTALSLSASYTPTFDSSQPNVAKNNEVMLGDQTDYACFSASEVSITGKNVRRVIEDMCAESAKSGAIIGQRSIEIQVKALLNQYDAKQIARFRLGSTVRFQHTMGPKTGGNWVAGSVVYSYSPTAKISKFAITNDAGLLSLDLTLEPFVSDTGAGEFFMGQL